jgi:quercetin dioxygenase-like cupin family protein
MGGLNIFDILFTTRKETSYDKACESLTRVEDIISNITMDYPDVSSKDIATIKNKWIELESPIADGVHTMGLHVGDDYKSLLVHYGQDSWLTPHFHSKEWEVIMILDGACEDKTTDTKLKKGDIFIIPKNAVHHVITTTEECYMYIMFSSNKHNLKISDSEKEIAKQLIGKRHSFKAK